MASARLKNGKWYYRITVVVGDGSHKYLERGSYRTKKEALDAGNKVEVAYKEGDLVTQKKTMTFNLLASEWLGQAESVYKQTTIQGYQKEMKATILPILGNFKITAITPKICREVLVKAARTDHTRSRLGRIKSCMSQCFKYAVRSGYLRENPMRDVSLPEIRSVVSNNLKPSRTITVLPKEEVEAIFKRFPAGHSDYIPLLLGYKAGLRLGEAFGLFIEDVDLDNGVLHVRRQIQIDESKNQLYLTDLKWCRPGQGRDIPLDSKTVNYLRDWIKQLLTVRTIMPHEVYYMDDAGYVNQEQNGRVINFLNVRLADGTYISPRTMRYVARVIHGKEGKFDCVDPNWDFHTLRHTHASECIAAGMSPVSVQKRLGHKNLATTYKYYVHETESQADQSADILEQMFDK